MEGGGLRQSYYKIVIKCPIYLLEVDLDKVNIIMNTSIQAKNKSIDIPGLYIAPRIWLRKLGLPHCAASRKLTAELHGRDRAVWLKLSLPLTEVGLPLFAGTILQLRNLSSILIDVKCRQ